MGNKHAEPKVASEKRTSEPENIRRACPRGKRNAVLTVGHSTRSIAEFIALLKAHDVTCLVDVRTIPRSRRNPQFNLENLPGSLESAGIKYVHTSALGGLRHSRADSPNGGWRNASFRGYADYMQTAEFKSALDELIGLACGEHVAIMCAEAVPWRCHRSLIGDALLTRGIQVMDIMSPTRLQEHKLTAFARVQGEKITYPEIRPECNCVEVNDP